MLITLIIKVGIIYRHDNDERYNTSSLQNVLLRVSVICQMLHSQEANASDVSTMLLYYMLTQTHTHARTVCYCFFSYAAVTLLPQMVCLCVCWAVNERCGGFGVSTSGLLPCNV